MRAVADTKFRKEDIVEIIRSIQGNVYSVYTDWVKMCATSIHNSIRYSKEMEEEYLTIAKKYSAADIKKLVDAFGILQILMDEKYDDYLGSIYMLLETGSKRTGQFFTPYHVSKLVAGLTDDEVSPAAGRTIINEPSCGAGANIIAFLEKESERGVNYQEQYEIIAQDIDWNCVYMCYVQLSLYGVYGEVVQGDTLADEMPPERNILRTPMFYMKRGEERCRMQKQR